MMKKTLCAFAVLMVTAVGWAGSRPEGIVARIAFVSDTHINLNTNGSGIAYNRRFDEAIAAINAARVDLVLIGGDLTDGGKRDQMVLFKKKVKRLKAPVLFVPGNHDVGEVGNENIKTTITPKRLELFSRELGPNWFACEKAGVRVVGINSCLFGSRFKEEVDQWQFLERELARRHTKPTLVLEHHPLFIENIAEARSGLRNVDGEARQRLLVLTEQARARAFLSGHLHHQITNRLDGILFLGNATTAFGLPQGKQPEGWLLLSVPREGEVKFEFRKLE